MLDEQHAAVQFATYLDDALRQCTGLVVIQASGRLIEHEDVGLCRNRARDTRAATVAQSDGARDLGRQVRDAEQFQCLQCVLTADGAEMTSVHGTEFHVLQDGEFLEDPGVLEGAHHAVLGHPSG